MKVTGLKLAQILTALIDAEYHVEAYKDGNGDIFVDVYAEEDSQRVLELSFDNQQEPTCDGYVFVSTGFANEYASHIQETLEALW